MQRSGLREEIGERVGGAATPPPLFDFYDGLESFRAPLRRGPGDGHDDGQLQAASDTQHVADGAYSDTQHSDPNIIYQELNQSVENAKHSERQSHRPTPNVGNITLDNMEIGEGNESVNEQQIWAYDRLVSAPRIMPPRRLKKKSIKRLVEKRVAKAIEEYEKTKANLDNAGSLGGNFENAGGTINVQGCSYKTFMNGKSHPFNGTKGVVGLRRWIEKEMTSRHTTIVSMCPNLVPNENKKVERYIRGFPKRIKGNITSSKPTTLHEAINMARELVEQAVQALAEGRGYAGNLPWCNRCKAHHQPGSCPPRCSNCHKLGHEEEDYRTRIPVARGNLLQNALVVGRKDTTGISVQEEETPRIKVLVAEPMLIELRSPSKIRT
ncbi:hypothetical protein Tco_0327327 [Tanacetum coccineum]